MRHVFLYAFVIAAMIYAWRDWFVSLCALIVLGAFAKHPDMPAPLMGVLGMDLWNLLLVGVTLAWAYRRINLPRPRAVPRFMIYTVGAYVLVLLVAFFRGYMDTGSLRADAPMTESMTRVSFLLDYLVNPLKWLWVAWLCFDGIRSRRNIMLLGGAIVAQAVVFSLMSIRYIPLGALQDVGMTSQFESPFRHRFQNRVGFHSNDLALALVAGFWTLASAAPTLWRMGWRYRLAGIGSGLAVALALALTNSRAGYLAVVLVGLAFGLVRWRVLLAVMPTAALVVFLSVPSVRSRMGLGFATQDVVGEQINDLNEITAGRTSVLWPAAMEEIRAAPVFGQGRMTMLRTAVYNRVVELQGSCPSHPHNAYLEMLMDAGIVGLSASLALFLVVPVYLYRRRRRDVPVLDMAACIGLAGAGTILTMGITGQSFWPREAVDLVMCVYALAMGAHVLGRQTPASCLGPVHRSGRQALAHAAGGARPGTSIRASAPEGI